MARVKLHGPLDGLLKAEFDTRKGELIMRYDGDQVELDEIDCDNLIRLAEFSHSEDQAESDLHEFFLDEVREPAARRMALWFNANYTRLDEYVYA
jgi:hypothetical protein